MKLKQLTKKIKQRDLERQLMQSQNLKSDKLLGKKDKSNIAIEILDN